MSNTEVGHLILIVVLIILALVSFEILLRIEPPQPPYPGEREQDRTIEDRTAAIELLRQARREDRELTDEEWEEYRRLMRWEKPQ